MTPGAVCVVGSANVDRFVGLARLPIPGETLLGQGLGVYPGGKGLNQAVAAAGCGATVTMCGAVGSDADGQLLLAAMRAHGVNSDAMRIAQGPTGIAHVFSLEGGENSIVVVPGANALVDAADAAAVAAGVRVVLAQLEISPAVVARALAAGRAAGAITVLNAAPASPAAFGLLGQVDVLIVNESEASELGGVDALRPLVTVVETRGADGAMVYPMGEPSYRVPAFVVDAVDTTGAGDAFCGGVAAALARGGTLLAAVREGAAAGAIVAQHRGAQTHALTPEALAYLAAGAGAGALASPRSPANT